MHLTLVERYIFRKSLLATLIAAGALIGVVWVVRAVQTVDVILSQGQGIVTYLKMTTLGVPTLTAAIAPLALLIGLVRVINALNDDSEMVVLHASGASRITLLKPFLLLCFLVSVTVYILQLWVGPYSKNLLTYYVSSARADLVSVVVKEGEFSKVGNGLTFHVGERSAGGVLKKLLIQDGRSEKETFVYLAQQGIVTKSKGSNFLVLQDGQIHRSNNVSGELSIIRFKSYAFNLSSFSGGTGSRTKGQDSISTYKLFFPDKNETLYKYAPKRYFAELHVRLTGGLYPLLVGLVVLGYMGNPVSHRQGQTMVVIAACSMIFTLRGITIYGEGAMRNITSMVYLVWFVPIATCITMLFLLATDRSAFSNTLYKQFEKAGSSLSRLTTFLRVKNRSKTSLREPAS